MSAEGARAAFARQAEICTRMRSTFMAALCSALAEILDDRTATGRRILGWEGDLFAAAVPMRIGGGLHSLVRSGAAPDLAALYPPASPDRAALAALLPHVIAAHDAALQRWLDAPPQTNEVGRSAVLMAGMLEVAAATRLPLRIFELGASAGLNLRLDAYAYDLGGLVIDPPAAPLRLKPEWHGTPPPRADVRIFERRACDMSPIDVADAQTQERLLAFVWADQTERLDRLAAALAAAAADPPPIDRADAADWTEAHVQPRAGTATVLFHSIAFQYFPPEGRRRIADHMEAAGSLASADAPLAWLRFEVDLDAPAEPPALRLRMWPGEDRLLARANPHGSSVEWLGAA